MKIRKCLLCAAIISIVGTISSCGSTKTAKPADIGEKFTSNVSITQQDKTFAATIKRGGPDIYEFEFSQPEAVTGMKITCSGDLCTLNFMGLSYAAQRDNLSDYSMITLAVSVIEQLCAKSDLTCTFEDDILSEKGNVNGHDYTATFKDDKLDTIKISDELTYQFA